MRPALLIALLLCLPQARGNELLLAPGQAPSIPGADGMARLIVDRDENAPNACDVELYIGPDVAATLAPGQSASLDLPNGELSLSASLSRAGYCGGLGPGTPQSIILQPGETRRFKITVQPGQVFLAPVDG
ncbi:hypothetical protein [Pseudomonas sp. LRF_L74]|uniref:hypothetical protein n=1 Tax=Pseudomonas sp. LRF_L74 TaxID=3369422 RepID=UPI003F6459AB